MSKEMLEKRFPAVFPGKVRHGWKNTAKGLYTTDAVPGLYMLDLEHIPEDVVARHNDPQETECVASLYRRALCLHNCPFCFNEESAVYSQYKVGFDGKAALDGSGTQRINRMMTLKETFGVIDQAREIADSEGHDFEYVKFLGPGELLMNPQLFEIIDMYSERKVHFCIFTKGAILGSDELAQKYQGMDAEALVDELAGNQGVSLLFSFQSFDHVRQNSLVTTVSENGDIKGLQEYSLLRDRALEYLFESAFYRNSVTDRLCMINAPIVPENLEESFHIYAFFVERGTPIFMTPSMVSGKGCSQLERQKRVLTAEEWQSRLVELYARIYVYNVKKGVQTHEEIQTEGIAAYVGCTPCNQAAVGLYIRANGIVQVCPGRFDEETVYGNVLETPLRAIWEESPNRMRGIRNPHNLINNRCPAKDGRTFLPGFYERVMERYEQLAFEEIEVAG
ncbi:MAG: radical SAM protein [Theionarchaea archaeon]|nr:radical SAM protein [Theionarchaea archaeon]MBU7000829.1 radical SAM protein [Theionarchaea archaeon]MBU7021630.1 radical SAM protein [Theionarchaea archaeon]MBU7034907.1 radical SAM protein [Theionarchaea archaeon]MBU7039383.1 radical SAM protein [Theionarchaea archaeon]